MRTTVNILLGVGYERFMHERVPPWAHSGPFPPRTNSPVSLLGITPALNVRHLSERKSQDCQNRQKTLGWPTILSVLVKMDGFDTRGFCRKVKDWMAGRVTFCTFRTFNENQAARRRGAGRC